MQCKSGNQCKTSNYTNPPQSMPGHRQKMHITQWQTLPPKMRQNTQKICDFNASE